MSGKNTIFNDKKINKSNFYRNKKPFIIDDTDVNRIVISKKDRYGKKKLLNILLGLMMMISRLNALIIVKQCLSLLLMRGCM